MSRFANLADKSKVKQAREDMTPKPFAAPAAQLAGPTKGQPTSNGRAGRKAIAAYFPPEMSLAMHECARKHGLSLQELMGEAFDDVLRKYGQSPVGGRA